MVIIWRGMGLVVPITFAACCYIVSFWIPPRQDFNALVGWSSLYAAIVCLLLGLSMLGTTVQYKDGKTAPDWKHHHFFFIPVIIWGLILGALSPYMLIERSPSAATANEDYLDPLRELLDTMKDEYKLIHFFNPVQDTLIYYISDENGFEEEAKLGPWTVASVAATNDSYFIFGKNLAGEYTLNLPWGEDYDRKKYKDVKEGKGSIAQRIVPRVTKSVSDYDDAWVMVNGYYNLAVIDISGLYSPELKPEMIDKINWIDKIQGRYSGKELIQLNIQPRSDDKIVVVTNPEEYFPESDDGISDLYLLLPYHTDTKLTNEYLRQEIRAFLP